MNRSIRARSKIWKYLLSTLAVFLFASGGYLLWLSLAPPLYMPRTPEAWNEPIPTAKLQLTENRLYVPKLKLNLTYKSGNESVLKQNAWHRFPERGDPEKGGNFILAGHRFEMGLTPSETKQKSPFYHLNTLELGDKVYADFNGTRYEYEITERFTVKPNQIEIEAPSTEPKMTLYSCTLKGEKDGREVLVARITKSNVDPAIEL